MDSTTVEQRVSAETVSDSRVRTRGPSLAVQDRRPSELGRRISELRRRKGLTQRDLSSGDFSPGYISAVEKGRIVPSIQALRLIAERLGEPPGALLFESPETDDPALLLDEAAVRLALPGHEDQAIALARSVHPVDLSLDGKLRRQFVLGRAELQAGRVAVALAELQAGLREVEAARPSPSVTLWGVRVRDVIGAAYRVQGERARALGAHRAAVQALRDAAALLTDPLLTRSVFTNLIADLIAMDQPDEALAVYQDLQALRLPEVGAAAAVERHLVASRARREAGDAAAALNHLSLAAGLADVLIEIRLRVFAEGAAAVARTHSVGEAALPQLGAAVEGARWTGDLALAASLANDLAEAYRSAGRLADSQASAVQALQFAEQARVVTERGRALLTLGALAAADDRVEEAEQHLRAAIAVLSEDEQRAGSVLGRAYYRLGKLMLESGRAAEAAPLLERAYLYGDRLG